MNELLSCRIFSCSIFFLSALSMISLFMMVGSLRPVHAIDHPLMAKGNGWSYTSYTMQAFLFSFVKNLTSSDQRSIDGVCTRNIGCCYSVVEKTKLGDSTVFAWRSWRSWRSRWNSSPHSWGSNSTFFLQIIVLLTAWYHHARWG